MLHNKRKVDVWTFVSLVIMAAFILTLLYPMIKIFRLAVLDESGRFTLQNFATFF